MRVKWDRKTNNLLASDFFGSEHNWFRDGTLPVQNGVALLFKSRLNPAMGGCNFIVYNDGICNLKWLYHDTSSCYPDISVVIFLGKQSSFQHVINRQLSTWSLWKLSIFGFPSQFIFFILKSWSPKKHVLALQSLELDWPRLLSLLGSPTFSYPNVTR